MEAVGIVEGISPVDRAAIRLVEWANLGSKELVEPQSMPYEVWVGGSRVRKPADADMGDAGGSDNPERQDVTSSAGSYMQFVINPENHDVTVKIIDRGSGEVIRTIPPEELARYAHESGMTPGAVLETLL